MITTNEIKKKDWVGNSRQYNGEPTLSWFN